jgi:hypothetical protein
MRKIISQYNSVGEGEGRDEFGEGRDVRVKCRDGSGSPGFRWSLVRIWDVEEVESAGID